MLPVETWKAFGYQLLCWGFASSSFFFSIIVLFYRNVILQVHFQIRLQLVINLDSRGISFATVGVGVSRNFAFCGLSLQLLVADVWM